MTQLPISAVLFDFHGTLAQVEDPLRWVVRAARACGHDLDEHRAGVLATSLLAAGRAGGPAPGSVPAHLADAWDRRDLAADAHRAAFSGLAATVDCDIDGLAAALYDRLLVADGWQLYPDALPVLAELRAAGIPVAVVSNIGFDLRPLADALGFGRFVDHFALSYEVGYCKPEPEIFLAACRALDVAPERALMVGDSPADAAAALAGCPTVLLPADPPGHEHGLRSVLGFVK